MRTPRQHSLLSVRKSKVRPIALIKSRTLLCLPLLVLASCGEPQQPNVLLITMDTTRADYLSTYGSESTQTPNLDALAARGVRFDMALSASAVTPVSHATIMTGLFPYEHGLRVLSAAGGYKLPADVPTIATTLKDRGYTTIAVHSAFPVSGHFGFNRGFDVFESFDIEMERSNLVQDRWDVSKGQRRSDETTDIALSELSEIEGPFFLWIHYWDPHDPVILPPAEYLPEGELNGRHVEIYAAEVQYLDSQFGRLMEGMSELDVLDNTMVCVTADHGQGLDDGLALHGWFSHRILYQEQIHVPLIFAGPQIDSGRTSDAIVRTADIPATFYDYLNVPPPGSMSGSSLRALIDGGEDEARTAYADQINGFDYNARMVENRPQAKFLYVVASNGWKLIYRPVDPDTSELYDLRADPREQDNRFKAEPAKAKALMRDLAARQPWVLDPFQADESDGPSDEAQSVLEALGYTGGGGQSTGVWSWYSISTGVVTEERDSLPASDCLPVLR
jgi:arylsulfatase A-like enzyme